MKPMKMHAVLLWAFLMFVAGASLAQSTRTVVAVSDLHVGAGKQGNGMWMPTEDFRWDDDFKAFLDDISKRQGGVDLVLAGDVFEMWQSPTMTCSTDHSHPDCQIDDCNGADRNVGCSETEAVSRLQYILKHHPGFVALLKRFVASGDHRIFIVPGNHDAALTFPKVRETLAAALASGQIKIMQDGYWMSDDGRIYADHGHQFDVLNSYDTWPVPYHRSGNELYLPRPWGENMVMQFYNQYEYIFPIVDNLTDETAGLKYALDRSSKGQKEIAARKFAKFLVVEESIRQKAILLGEDDTVIKDVDWDDDWVRNADPVFFIDVLKTDPQVYAMVSPAVAADKAAFGADTFTHKQIDLICRQKALLYKQRADLDIMRCPHKDGHLGAILGAMVNDQVKIRGYLEDVLTQLADGKHHGHVADVYIYGHTHRAKLPLPIDIVSQFGVDSVEVVNTGAFQRLATPAQIAAISPLRQRTSQGHARELNPEDLPACYTYVLVDPYTDKPHSALMKWSIDASGKMASSAGTCLD